jgi:hypothetical protein
MAPTAATPCKATDVAKLAPALITYCKVTGGSVLATPPLIDRGARHSRSTRHLYLLKAEITVQKANPHTIIFLVGWTAVEWLFDNEIEGEEKKEEFRVLIRRALRQAP